MNNVLCGTVVFAKKLKCNGNVLSFKDTVCPLVCFSLAENPAVLQDLSHGRSVLVIGVEDALHQITNILRHCIGETRADVIGVISLLLVHFLDIRKVEHEPIGEHRKQDHAHCPHVLQDSGSTRIVVDEDERSTQETNLVNKIK